VALLDEISKIVIMVYNRLKFVTILKILNLRNLLMNATHKMVIGYSRTMDAFYNSNGARFPVINELFNSY
jgi:hypothetical protein